jgi:hypothetical protein
MPLNMKEVSERLESYANYAGYSLSVVRVFGSRFPQFHSQIFCFHAENRIDTNQATIYFVSRRRLKGLAK